MRWCIFLLATAAWAQSAESIQAQLASVARQRDAVRAQARSALTAAAPPRDSPAPVCDPIAETDPMIDAAAQSQKLPPKLVRAVIAQESAFRPCAESKKGAMGLMQLLPSTAEEFDVSDPFDAESNLAAGTKYLRQLVERYKGDLRLALAAYNAGPSAVEMAGGVPQIPETRDYVDTILAVLGIKRLDLPSIPTPKPIGN